MLPRGNETRRSLAVLGALCFFLSALEYMIPKPLPFIRIGLANMPLLLALDIMPFSSFLYLIGLKIIGQALISGTLFSYVFLFSLGGTGVSALLMFALRRGFGKKMISLIGVSAAGALASNGVQLALARYFVLGESVRYMAAPVLALGLVTGTLLGFCCEYFIRRSRWYRMLENPAAAGNIELMAEVPAHPRSDSSNNFSTNLTNPFSVDNCRTLSFLPFVLVRVGSWLKIFLTNSKAREAFCRKTFSSGELAVAGLCMIPALLLNQDTHTRIIQFLFFFFLAWLSGKKMNPLITFSVMLGIIFFNLLVPYGEILFSLGPLAITYGALIGGIKRAVTLEALFMLSRCCVSRDIVLPSFLKPGFFGEIIGESFRIFSGLAEEKQFFTRKNWIVRLDDLLVASGDTTEPASTPDHVIMPEKRKGSFKSRLILIVTVILAWLPLVKLICR